MNSVVNLDDLKLWYVENLDRGDIKLKSFDSFLQTFFDNTFSYLQGNIGERKFYLPEHVDIVNAKMEKLVNWFENESIKKELYDLERFRIFYTTCFLKLIDYMFFIIPYFTFNPELTHLLKQLNHWIEKNTSISVSLVRLKDFYDRIVVKFFEIFEVLERDRGIKN